MNALLLVLASILIVPAKAEVKTYTCELRSANSRNELDTTLLAKSDINSGIAETASILLIIEGPLVVGVTTGYEGIKRIDLAHQELRAASFTQRWNDMDPAPATLVDQSAGLVYSARCFLP